MVKEKEIFNSFLKTKDLKLTNQRKYVLNAFLSTEQHVSVDDLYHIVKQDHPRVGYATVFRTLKLLCESGLASPVFFGDKRIRFEHVYGHKKHIHLICINCGAVIEQVSKEIEDIKEKLCKRSKFSPESFRVDIFGKCVKCKDRKI